MIMTALSWDEFTSFLAGSTFDDIAVEGFTTTSGGVSRLYPFYNDIYLNADNGLIRLSSYVRSVDPYEEGVGGALKIIRTNSYAHNSMADLELGHTETRGLVSLWQLYFGAREVARCRSATALLDDESDPAAGLVRALVLGFDDVEITLDPVHSFGIRASMTLHEALLDVPEAAHRVQRWDRPDPADDGLASADLEDPAEAGGRDHTESGESALTTIDTTVLVSGA
jgi:hypothetical protein